MPLKIAVIGDLMLDEYLYGNADRISQEAPIPVVHVQKREIRSGGAANVCANLVDLGAQVDIVGLLGCDGHGDELVYLLENKGVNTRHILRVEDWTTTCKTRIVSRKQQMLRIDHEITKDAPPAFIDTVTNILNAMTYDFVILQDYAKGVLTQDLIDALRGRPGLKNKIAMDPNPRNRLDIANVLYALKPNFHEALAMTHTLPFELNENDLASRETLAKLGEKLFALCNAPYIFITLGEHGIAVFDNGEMRVWEATQAKEVYDVSGAGDTTLAALVHALGHGKSLLDTVRFANKAASIVVSKFGTASVGALEFDE